MSTLAIILSLIALAFSGIALFAVTNRGFALLAETIKEELKRTPKKSKKKKKTESQPTPIQIKEYPPKTPSTKPAPPSYKTTDLLPLKSKASTRSEWLKRPEVMCLTEAATYLGVDRDRVGGVMRGVEYEGIKVGSRRMIDINVLIRKVREEISKGGRKGRSRVAVAKKRYIK